MRGIFSPAEKFVVFWSERGRYPVYVVDEVSGITLNTLRNDDPPFHWITECKFFSDEGCVVVGQPHSGHHLHLFNVKSGDLLSVVDVGGTFACSAACSYENLIAIGYDHRFCGETFQVIRAWLPRDKDSLKSKKVSALLESKTIIVYCI